MGCCLLKNIIILKSIIKILVVGIIALVVMVMSCGTSEIIDVIHKDTDELNIENYKGLDPTLERYQIDGVLLIPYIRNIPKVNAGEEFYAYTLRLASYKNGDDQKQVTINSVSVEGIKNVELSKISKKVDKNLDFKKLQSSNKFESNGNVLIDEINHHDMKLDKNSEIKVMLNVSVKDGEDIITRDLEYVFTTRIRRYLNQR